MLYSDIFALSHNRGDLACQGVLMCCAHADRQEIDISEHPTSQLEHPSWGHQESGKKKQHKHKLFGPDFARTFLTLTPGCPGVKKFLPTTGAAGKRTFWRGRPRFSARTSMTRRVVEKLCTKKFALIFRPLKKDVFD